MNNKPLGPDVSYSQPAVVECGGAAGLLKNHVGPQRHRPYRGHKQELSVFVCCGVGQQPGVATPALVRAGQVFALSSTCTSTILPGKHTVQLQLTCHSIKSVYT